MSNFFRKTSIKTITATICLVCLCLAMFSGLGVFWLLSGDGYESDNHLFTTMAQNKLYQDMADVMHNYFDPAEPSQPWVSYYSGGIYTGENSNFRYDIVDESTGYSVLATVEGGEPILCKTTNRYSFTVERPEPKTEDYVISDTLFYVGSTLFIYDEYADCFSPATDSTTSTLSASLTRFPSDLYQTGFAFTYGGGTYVQEDEEHTYELSQSSHYIYDGTDFVYTEDWSNYVTQETSYTIIGYVLSPLSAHDGYQVLSQCSSLLLRHRYDLLWILGLSLAVGLCTLVLLGNAIALSPNDSQPQLHLLFRLPTDLALILTFIVGCLGAGCYVELFYWYETAHLGKLMVLLCGSTAFPIAALYGLMLLISRGRCGVLFSGSLLGGLFRWMRKLPRWCKSLGGKILGYLPLLWKVAVCYLALCFVEFVFLILFSYTIDGTLVFFWFVEKLVLGALVGYVALCFRRLKKGAETIAAGDYTTRVDENHLVLDFQDCANTLNHIQDGMNTAVESRMKSERLKTELITNVSHDIKTPLTSIVSYVDLLKQEPTGSPAAGEYLEVLERQSARLKKLVEDLVEASKASTGNITVHSETMDLNIVLGQALGEYEGRLKDVALTPVLKLPESPTMISADGRLLWRIFDNLLGNAGKYAMPGTRLYVTLSADSHAIVTFRNISREALDVSPDELMERFVRGDASRHTEGSGLGLSIAKSLTESMGGQFLLNVDGDLFKVAVIFPLISPEN